MTVAGVINISKCQPQGINDITFLHNIYADLLYISDKFTVSNITTLIELRSGLYLDRQLASECWHFCVICGSQSP